MERRCLLVTILFWWIGQGHKKRTGVNYTLVTASTIRRASLTVLSRKRPACLGMGAMLAGANQAVIGHISEVGSFVAPLFCALMAVGLQRDRSFFPGVPFRQRHPAARARCHARTAQERGT